MCEKMGTDGGQFPSVYSLNARLKSPRVSAFDLLHYKDANIRNLAPLVPGMDQLPSRILERIDIEGRYKQQ